MERQRVSSSNLYSVGYDVQTLKLQVQFHTGRVYEYSNVPDWQYARLMGAISKGSYFDTNIKEKYITRRIL